MAATDLPQLSETCDNCRVLLQGPFCHKCGQEKRNILRNAFSLIGEFFGEFSNWDARLWRTLIPLWFKPGKLTQHYVNGHRVPYVPALRLYLFSSIIAFLVFAKLIPTDDIQFSNTDGLFGVQYNPETPLPPDVASRIAEAQALSEEHSAAPITPLPPTVKNDTSNKAPLKLLELDGDADMEQQLEQLFEGKLTRLKDNPQLAINKFFSLAPQMMFLMLPLFALLLKLLYVRQQRFYMEHLLLCLHSHSFMLHMFIVFVLLAYLAPLTGVVALQQGLTNLGLVVLWYMPIYLFLSQKIFYGQSWLKTAVKFSLFSLSYMVLLSFALLTVLLLSLYWA